MTLMVRNTSLLDSRPIASTPGRSGVTARRCPPRITLEEAEEALADMKGERVIDCNVGDDRVCGILMEYPPFVRPLVVARYKQGNHKYPTEKVVEDILLELEQESCFGPDTERFD